MSKFRKPMPGAKELAERWAAMDEQEARKKFRLQPTTEKNREMPIDTSDVMRMKDADKMEVINRLTAENARMKQEMNEAAAFINLYLQEIPLHYEPHNWLIRNGYKDESYQSSTFGQEIFEPCM